MWVFKFGGVFVGLVFNVFCLKNWIGFLFGCFVENDLMYFYFYYCRDFVFFMVRDFVLVEVCYVESCFICVCVLFIGNFMVWWVVWS